MKPVPAVRDLRSRVDRLVGLRDASVKRLRSVKDTVSRLESEEELLDITCEMFRKLIDRALTAGVRATETLLTEGVQAVFQDQELSVRAEVEVQRGKVAVDLVTVEKRADGSVVHGLSVDAFGGSVSAVESVLLRIIVMMRRGLRPLLLLDETLPAFDSNYVVNMGAFLSMLCQKLGIDVLLVSHNPAMVEAAHRAYQVYRTTEGAQFRRIR